MAAPAGPPAAPAPELTRPDRLRTRGARVGCFGLEVDAPWGRSRPSTRRSSSLLAAADRAGRLRRRRRRRARLATPRPSWWSARCWPDGDSFRAVASPAWTAAWPGSHGSSALTRCRPTTASSDMRPEIDAIYRSGRLETAPGRPLRPDRSGKVPKAACAAVERLLGLDGDLRDRVRLGRPPLRRRSRSHCREAGSIADAEAIETMVHQATIAMRRFRAEAELRKTAERVQHLLQREPRPPLHRRHRRLLPPGEPGMGAHAGLSASRSWRARSSSTSSTPTTSRRRSPHSSDSARACPSCASSIGIGPRAATTATSSGGRSRAAS